MTRKTIIDTLIKVADDLDAAGDAQGADEIDSLLEMIKSKGRDVQELELEIPEDEMQLLQQISEALRSSLAIDNQVGS